MITVFSIPKPFAGHIGTIQRNAIRSWLKIPGAEIILFGDEPGTEAASTEFHVAHVSQVQKNEYGTPLLDHVFEHVQAHGKHENQMYVNCDIILPPNLSLAVDSVGLTRFLICGQRWDLDIDTELAMEGEHWHDELWQTLPVRGRLHGPSAIDYLIFQRHTVTMPPFAVGRPRWDNWVLWDMKMRGIPIVDATPVIKIIHQNHDYSHSAFGEKTRVGGPELRRNEELAGTSDNLLTLRDADWTLSQAGLRRPEFPRWLMSRLARFAVWRRLLGLKRNLQTRLGLR